LSVAREALDDRAVLRVVRDELVALRHFEIGEVEAGATVQPTSAYLFGSSSEEPNQHPAGTTAW